jgi:hypothetical protein
MQMTGSVDFSGQVVPGKELELRLTFTLANHSELYDLWTAWRDTLNHRIQAGDTSSETRRHYEWWSNAYDSVYFVPDTNITFVGPNGWAGKILPGVPITLSFRILLKHPVSTQICAVVGMFWSWSPDEKGAMKITPGTTNSFCSEPLFPGTSVQRAPNPYDTLPNGVIIRTVGGTMPPPGPEKKIIKLSDSLVSPPRKTNQH